MGMKRFWYAGEPGQRSSVGRELWEAPVEDRGYVACGSEVATGGRCQQVAEWVLTSFGREVEQVCPQGRPGGFSGESGDVLIGLVELCDGLGPRPRWCIRPARRKLILPWSSVRS
jgi:hypothetical protein